MGGDDLVDEYFDFQESAKRPASIGDGGSDDVVQKKKKKRKKSRNGTDSDGEDVGGASGMVQSKYLRNFYARAIDAEGAGVGDAPNRNTDEEISDSGGGEEMAAAAPPELDVPRFHAPTPDIGRNYANYLRKAVSSYKAMKKWNGGRAGGEREGPMVIVVCLSARRCVDVLKDIAPLKVRVAKLFAKHMDADAQVKSLGPGQSPPVAVGTPARLRLLAERGALRLGRTEIFVVDNFRDGRGLTIVSDREASVDLAKFMQETVLPEMKKRETIKIGVF